MYFAYSIFSFFFFEGDWERDVQERLKQMIRLKYINKINKVLYSIIQTSREGLIRGCQYFIRVNMNNHQLQQEAKLSLG